MSREKPKSETRRHKENRRVRWLLEEQTLNAEENMTSETRRHEEYRPGISLRSPRTFAAFAPSFSFGFSAALRVELFR
ncbi:MAG: hypothetical protein WDZ63_17510 [Burkholderiales bacterium]